MADFDSVSDQILGSLSNIETDLSALKEALTSDSEVLLDDSSTDEFEEYQTVTLDDQQFDQLMVTLTAQTQIQLFQLAFAVLIFGTLLGMCLFKLWRP